jgi:hypothetical protein
VVASPRPLTTPAASAARILRQALDPLARDGRLRPR